VTVGLECQRRAEQQRDAAWGRLDASSRELRAARGQIPSRNAECAEACPRRPIWHD
jgi:hypothetical protein